MDNKGISQESFKVAKINLSSARSYRACDLPGPDHLLQVPLSQTDVTDIFRWTRAAGVSWTRRT